MRNRLNVNATWLVLIAGSAIAGSGAAAAPADEAVQTFQSIYGSRLKQVQATRDRADDTALAKQFIESAKQSANLPALAALLCNEAHDLTKLHEPAVARDAMRLLIELSPADRKAANEKMVRLLTVISRTGGVDARKAAVNELIALYTSQGDAALQANGWREASSGYRKALFFASQHKHASTETLKGKIKAVADQQRTVRRVEQLEESLLRDASDQTALKELVFAYPFDLADKPRAARHVSRVNNAALKSQLQLAVQDEDSLNAADSLRLADWLLAAAKEATAGRQNTIRHMAASAYRRYLTLQTTLNIERTKAELILKQLDAQLVATPRVRPSKSTSSNSRVPFRAPNGMKPVIQLSLDDREGSTGIADLRDRKRKWTAHGTLVVTGVRGKARQFNGSSDAIDVDYKSVSSLANKRMVVAAWIKSEKADGVIFACGGNYYGYSFYLKSGHLEFARCRSGARKTVVATKPLPSGWVHVSVDAQVDGKIALFVNGKQVGEGQLTGQMNNSPGETYSLGADTGPTNVGKYGDEHFKGIIDEFQVWISE